MSNEVTTIEPPSQLWAVLKDKTEPHWLEVQDPDGWYSAVVKWDGCVDFRRYHNSPIGEPGGSQLEDYIHLCDLDDFIARLQALKAEALKHFGEDNWPG